MVLEIPIGLHRHAFTVRDVARAGDVWRAFQEVAVRASTRCGWPPARYRDAGSAFVMRSMVVDHHREARYGEEIRARTWLADFRRGILTRREVRIEGEDGVISSASQEWVHVNARLKPTRASAELLASFPPADPEPPPKMPRYHDLPGGSESRFAFPVWHTWMDPLGHANHPAYIDWCDEAVSQLMAHNGLDPAHLQPVAERVDWKSGVESPADVEVLTRRIGFTGSGDIVLTHLICTADRVAAKATTVRRMANGQTEALSQALG